jgi:hypothetical protein
MPTDKFLRGSNFVSVSDVLNLEEFVKSQSGSVDLTDLETKTQNISLVDTDNTKTTFTNLLQVGSATTTQTTFTQDQELVTKKYVDDNTGSSGNKEIFDFTNKDESDYLSALTGSSTGVANALYNGEYVTVKSAVTASAGRVMSFDASSNNADEYEIAYCDGNTGEQDASSQALGVLLEDVIAGSYCKVATKGICSVLIGSTTTAQRGCMVTLGGSASSFQGRVVCTSRTSNEPSIGICMSRGSKSANDPIVVFLQATFESY